MIGVREIDMEEFLEGLRTFECPPPDPSEFIVSSENATMSKIMMGNQNGKGYVPTQEERERRSKTMTGRKYDAKRRKNQSIAQTGMKHSAERCAKKSLINTGKKWYNDGKTNKFSHECPKGFVPGMLRRKK